MPPRPRSIIAAVLLCAGVVLLPGSVAAAVSGWELAPGGVERYEFTLTKKDKAALKAQRKAERKQQAAAKARKRSDQYSRRIAQVEALIEQAQEQEGTLRVRLEGRLVHRYKEGGTLSGDDTAWLMAADGVTDAIDRAQMLDRQDRQDRQLVAEYDVTLDRLQQLEQLLQQLRDSEGERALALEEQATALGEHVHDARMQHVEASADEKVRKGAGKDGTWLVAPEGGMGFAMLAGLSGKPGAAWNGGTTTPARPASAAQISAVLADPRIDVYSGGRIDIATGRVDGRILDALRGLAERFGSVTVTSLITGHGVYTSSGNVSMHTYGCAVDIGSVAGQIIQPASQGPGSITEASVLFLAGLPGDLAPHQVISLHSYGGPTLAMGDHGDHIHLGYAC